STGGCAGSALGSAALGGPAGSTGLPGRRGFCGAAGPGFDPGAQTAQNASAMAPQLMVFENAISHPPGRSDRACAGQSRVGPPYRHAINALGERGRIELALAADLLRQREARRAHARLELARCRLGIDLQTLE